MSGRILRVRIPGESISTGLVRYVPSHHDPESGRHPADDPDCPECGSDNWVEHDYEWDEHDDGTVRERSDWRCDDCGCAWSSVEVHQF